MTFAELNKQNMTLVNRIEETLEQVWSGDIEESAASRAVLSDGAAIENYIDANVTRNLTASLEKSQSSLDLVLTALKLYYASGNIEVLNIYRARIEERTRGYRNSIDTKRYVTLLKDWETGIKNGLGRIVMSSHVAKNGDTLFEVDEKKSCATLDNGKFIEKSNTARKHCLHRFMHCLQWVNLINPRMYKAPTKHSIDKVEEAVKKLAKTFDENSQAMFTAMLEAGEAYLANLVERVAAEGATREAA